MPRTTAAGSGSRRAGCCRAAASAGRCWGPPRAGAPGAPTGPRAGSAARRRTSRRPSTRARSSSGQLARECAGRGEHVEGAHPRREQRLVRVAQRRVGDRDRRLGAQRRGERGRTELEQALARPVGRRLAPVGGGSFSRGSISPAGGSRSRLMVTSVKSREQPRGAVRRRGRRRSGPGARRRRWCATPPARKSGWRSSARRKLWLVRTPRTRSSATRAAGARRGAAQVGPRAVTLTSSGSKYGETSAPTKAEPSSRRMPAPPGER